MPQSRLKTIRANLARQPGHPVGNDLFFYRFTAPLTDDGHLDPEGWKANRDRCRVVRNWGGEEEDIGHLIHRPGGSWGFTYDIDGDEGDESGFKLSTHTFRQGDYVTIRDDDGKENTFQVVSVIDA